MIDENLVNVGIITNSLSRNAGGLFTSVRMSALQLSRLGHSVSIFGLDDEYMTEDIAAWGTLKPHLARRVGPAILGFSPSLGKMLRAEPISVLHQHGIWQWWSRKTIDWAKRNANRVVISPRGMLDPWALGQSNWKKRLAAATYESQNLQNSACIHALNQSEAKSIRTYGLKNPIAIIPNGANLPKKIAISTALRPDWLPNDGKKTLLFLGRIHPKKGLPTLIKAWDKVKGGSTKVFSNWRLVIAGWDDGGHIKELLNLVDFLGLNESIIFPGALHYDDKHKIFAHSDAFVLPSLSEGLPVAVLEAWSYGLPVFMTSECNLPEGFSAGAAVEVVREPAALANSLVASLQSDDLSVIGSRARSLVKSRFSWDYIGEQHSKLYQWVANRGCKPSFIQEI